MKETTPKVSAIIPAAGIGKRFCTDIKKQFFLLDGNPILYYTMKTLNDAYPFDEFVVGASAEDFKYIYRIADKLGITRISLSEGGGTRTRTVLNALRLSVCDYVLIHDAVRPFVPHNVVGDTIRAGMEYGSAICGVYARDTVKRVKDGITQRTEDRDSIFLAHTPQVFRRETLLAALEKAEAEGVLFTDESTAYEAAGYKSAARFSNADNIKITELADIPIACALVKKYFPKIN